MQILSTFWGFSHRTQNGGLFKYLPPAENSQYVLNRLVAASLLLVVTLISCTPAKKASRFSNGTMQCEVYLGEYSLQHAGIEMMPYENHTQAIFTDSTGRLDTFNISFRKKRRSVQMLDIYPKTQSGDTTCFCFIGQYFNCYLESKTSGLKFRIDVAAKPLCLNEQRDCKDANSKKRVDIINIFYTAPEQKNRSFLIFHKVMGQNSISEHYGALEHYPVLRVHHREFQTVEQVHLTKSAEPQAPVSILYYSTAEGIVAFSINGQALWRLESLI